MEVRRKLFVLVGEDEGLEARAPKECERRLRDGWILIGTFEYNDPSG